MRLFLFLALFVFNFTQGEAFANCTDPDGTPGTIVFNDSYDVFQGCTKAGTWRAFHSVQGGGGGGMPTCPAGTGLISTGSGWECMTCLNGPLSTVCSEDGAIYIGMVDDNRIYAAPVDETGNFQWKTSNTPTGTPNRRNGFANTYPALNNAAHPAGRACATKAPAGTWYLPAELELALFWDNGNRGGPTGPIDLTGIGIHASDWYWASTENGANFARMQRFDDGTPSNHDRTNSHRVRCVRR